MEELLGRTIEHFRVVEMLGKGGMGSIYIAYDEKLQRRVALKALRHEFCGHPEARQRFLREARLLSKLDHPNICRIYNIIEGHDLESDYLVLELIQGENLKELLKKPMDKNLQMNIARELLNVLTMAHEKGIIHRDLKPSNLMVTPEGTLKVLDFGLARTSDCNDWTDWSDMARFIPGAGTPQAQPGDMTVSDIAGADRALFEETADIRSGELKQTPSSSAEYWTSWGTVLGTIGYMSPEQARGEQVTVASDIYSSGLIFQELFTLKAATRQTPDPMARFQAAKRGETLPITGLEPDLTNLINRMKSFYPHSRPTAIDASERLAYIQSRPSRRRRKVLLASGISFLLIVACIMTGLSLRLRHEVQRVAQSLAETQEVADYLVEIFKMSDPYEKHVPSVNEILDRGSADIQTRFVSQPLMQARFMEVFGTIYQRMGQYQKAETFLEDSLKIRTETLPSGHKDIAGSLKMLADIYQIEARYADAETLYTKALEMSEQNYGLIHPKVAEVLDSLAANYATQGQYDQSEPLYHKALAIREKILGPDHVQVAETLCGLALLYADQGKFAQSEPLYLRALSIEEKVLGPEHPELAITLQNLAGLYYNLNKFDQSEALYLRAIDIKEKALGPNHPEVATSLQNLAGLYHNHSLYDKAEPLYVRALSIERATLDSEHPSLATTLQNLAVLYYHQGKYDQSEQYYLHALAIEEKVLGPDHPSLAITLQNIAGLYVKQGQYDQGIPLYLRALAIREHAFGPDHQLAAQTLALLSWAYFKQGLFEKAQLLTERALEIREQTYPAGHAWITILIQRLAWIYREMKQYEKSEELFQRALTIYQTQPDQEPEWQIEALTEYATLLRMLKRDQEATLLDDQATSLRNTLTK
ncbi:serine/threonine protein kinase [bacterium]|nr:serine/threonine protein kinase [bacterium]